MGTVINYYDFQIESVLKSSANETFLAYFNRTMVDWDKFQQDVSIFVSRDESHGLYA